MLTPQIYGRWPTVPGLDSGLGRYGSPLAQTPLGNLGGAQPVPGLGDVDPKDLVDFFSREIGRAHV